MADMQQFEERIGAAKNAECGVRNAE